MRTLHSQPRVDRTSLAVDCDESRFYVQGRGWSLNQCFLQLISMTSKPKASNREPARCPSRAPPRSSEPRGPHASLEPERPRTQLGRHAAVAVPKPERPVGSASSPSLVVPPAPPFELTNT